MVTDEPEADLSVLRDHAKQDDGEDSLKQPLVCTWVRSPSWRYKLDQVLTVTIL